MKGKSLVGRLRPTPEGVAKSASESHLRMGLLEKKEQIFNIYLQ